MSGLLTKLLPTNPQGTSKAALKIRDHIPLMIALMTIIAKQLKMLMRIVIATEKHRMIALMTTIAKQLKMLMRTVIATEKERRMSGLLTKLLATNLQGTSKAGLKIRGHNLLMIALMTTIAKQLKTLMRTAIATEKQRRMSGLLTKLLATNLQGTSKAGLKIRGRIPLSGLLLKMLNATEKQR